MRYMDMSTNVMEWLTNFISGRRKYIRILKVYLSAITRIGAMALAKKEEVVRMRWWYNSLTVPYDILMVIGFVCMVPSWTWKI